MNGGKILRRSKFIRVLLLSIAAMLVFASVTMADSYYEFVESNDFFITYPEVYEENNIEDKYEDLVVGYNYRIRYRLPVMELYYVDDEYDDDLLISPSDYTVSWDIVPLDFTNEWLNIEQITSDDSSDILIVNGVLSPAISGDYNFAITAEIVDVADKEQDGVAIGLKTSFDTELTISLIDDTHILVVSGDTSFDECVVFEDSVDLGQVTPDYKVVVNAPYTTSRRGIKYSDYIQSPDYGDDFEVIDLPEWLTFDIVSTSFDEENDEDRITSVVVYFNHSHTSILNDGTKGVVRIPFIDRENGDPSFVMGWDVTFVSKDEEPEPIIDPTPVWTSIDIDPKTLTFSFTSTDADTQYVRFINHAPVRYIKPDTIPETAATITVNIPTDQTITSGSIDITVKPTMLISADYSGVITFIDSEGAEASVNIAISIREPSKEFINRSFDVCVYDNNRFIMKNPVAVNIKASGDVKHVVLKASGDISGDIQWTVSNDFEGLTITPESMIIADDVSVDFTVKADSTVKPDRYSVRIDASFLSDDEKLSSFVLLLKAWTCLPKALMFRQIYHRSFRLI